MKEEIQRYAAALFSLSEGETQGVEQACSALLADHELWQTLTSPAVSQAQKEELIRSAPVLEGRQPLQAFLILLLQEGKISQFPKICASIRELVLAAQGGSLRVFLAAVGALYILVLIALVNGLRRLLQHHGAPKTLNAVLTTLASFLLAFALMGGIIYGAFQAVSHGLLDTEPAAPAAVPLELEELTGEPSEETLTRQSFSATPLLARQDVTCYGRGQYTDLLDYRVLTVHLPALYGLCRDRLMEEMTTGPVFSGQTWREEDAAPWGAQAAWQLYNQDGLETHCYLLCYDGRIIRLSASWPPTEVQMSLVGQSLGGA